jgi:hypothetical protein
MLIIRKILFSILSIFDAPYSDVIAYLHLENTLSIDAEDGEII